jgi:hypothetical protein
MLLRRQDTTPNPSPLPRPLSIAVKGASAHIRFERAVALCTVLWWVNQRTCARTFLCFHDLPSDVVLGVRASLTISLSIVAYSTL